MSIRVRNKIYEGTTKILYETQDEYIIVQFFKDTIKINEQVIEISGKGVLNNQISAAIMSKLDFIGIDNHFIDKVNMREQIVQFVDIIPIKVTVNNIAYGKYVSDFGVEEGYVFNKPIIDLKYKQEGLITPVNENQAINLGLVSGGKEIKNIQTQAYRINDFLTGIFAAIGFKLASCDLEFGVVFNGEEFVAMLADEISPDTCVLFDSYNYQNEDYTPEIPIQTVSLYLYQEIAKRLKYML